MNYWHMQLHPDIPKWGREKELLETLSIIGLGKLKEEDKQIKNFKEKMRVDDIVLIKRGSTPIALVKINGELEIKENKWDELDWFKYRREIEVLDYATDMPPFPQPRGALQKAIDKQTLSYKYIDDWYNKLSSLDKYYITNKYDFNMKIFRQLLKSMKEEYLIKEDNKILKNLLPNDFILDIQSENISVCFAKGRVEHFDSIFIEKYKVFKDFEIKNLNRINIFAGFNNTGKTSLLEAIYLLTKQNDIGAFFELVKLKNKLSKLNTQYLNSYFEDDIKIDGNFNGAKTKIIIKKFEAKDIDKKDDYLTSYESISSIDEEKLNNTIHTFELSPIIRYVDRVEILCNSIFKSPYFYNQKEIINTHSKNIEIKEFDLIVKFITNNIDKNIQSINLTEKDNIKRFLVDSRAFPEKSVDITSYGEGLQRIFEIALSFAYCKNGVLLIDELETAIHYSLLIDFTKFIQELAREFNVQVFITSHSKECIDAFVNNEFDNEDITAYILKNIDGNIDYRYVTGNKLASLVESMNIDIRGKQND